MLRCHSQLEVGLVVSVCLFLFELAETGPVCLSFLALLVKCVICYY